MDAGKQRSVLVLICRLLGALSAAAALLLTLTIVISFFVAKNAGTIAGTFEQLTVGRAFGVFVCLFAALVLFGVARAVDSFMRTARVSQDTNELLRRLIRDSGNEPGSTMSTEPTKLGEAASDAEIAKALAESDLFGIKLETALDRIIQGAAHGEPIQSGEAVSDEEWNTMSDGEFYTRLSAAFGRRLASEMDKITDEDSAESGHRERENPTES